MMLGFAFTTTRTLAATLTMIAAITLVGCGDEHAGHDHAPGQHGAAPSATADYPLDTCVVSGEKLGSMGEPIPVTHEGVEVKLCCQGCVDPFNKEPQKYVAMVKAAAAAKNPVKE